MRFFIAFFCLFALSACQDDTPPAADFEDEFLLLSQQTMTKLSSGYDQDVALTALVHNRVDDSQDDGLWIRTTLPWLRLGNLGELDTRHLERAGKRAAQMSEFLGSGTLSRIEDGEVKETRIADPALYKQLKERFGDKVETLLNQSTATSVPLPDDPRPGDHWSASAALWGLPPVNAEYRVLARQGERVLMALTLDGDNVEGQARMIARLPSGMPEALRLSSRMTLPEQEVEVEQRLMLLSQRHYPLPVNDWDLDPVRVQMYSDFFERQLHSPNFHEPRDPTRWRDRAELKRLLESLADSLFYEIEEGRVLTRGDWVLASELGQVNLRFTGFHGDPPEALVLNRLAESGGLYRLAEPVESLSDRDLLIPRPDTQPAADAPFKVDAIAELWLAGEPVTVRRDGQGLPEGVSIDDWKDGQVQVRVSGAARIAAQPLGEDGEPIAFAMVSRPAKQGDESAKTFVERLTLGLPEEVFVYQSKSPIRALRVTPLRSEEQPLTLTLRPTPEPGNAQPPGVRHGLSSIPPLPDAPETLIEQMEISGLQDNRLRVTGPPGLRLCTLTPEQGTDYHGTPLHFSWVIGGGDDDDARSGFELRTEDDKIQYFYGRDVAFQVSCPARVHTVTATRERPGCVEFVDPHSVRVPEQCNLAGSIGFDARDATGLALQPLNDSGNRADDNTGGAENSTTENRDQTQPEAPIHRFWGTVQEVVFLRTEGERTREMNATLPGLPQ
ncbi:hypothetical protein [Alloalcanivorax mobilis]|uniref:hypothetical protein n=1 Tax=Alloalcanivorax mobilis TaxID=2019569 RepID=UPI000C78DBC5|nr:hypothetical protein [Alloalcanivorax mobilis]